MCYFADGKTEAQRGGGTCHPTGTKLKKSVPLQKPVGPTSPRSAGAENLPTPGVPGGQDRADSLVSAVISLPPHCLLRGGVGVAGGREPGRPVLGWTCLTASQSGPPELALERPWPHLAGTLYLCPWTQKGPCLYPAVLIPHAPDCPSPSASRKAHFVESKD